MTDQINVVRDPDVDRNWASLFNILGRDEDYKSDNKASIDQIILQLVYNWLEKRDQCGAAKDLLDVALYNVAGNTLDGLTAEDLDKYLPPGYNTTDFAEDTMLTNGIVPSTTTKQKAETHHDKGERFLSFFAEETCSSFETTMMLGSFLSFSRCTGLDIGKLMGTVEENIVNVGLTCLNTFLNPLQRSKTCASRNFQNYVMDQCVKAIVRDDILGHIFQLFLVSPKKTCGCMPTLAKVPQCRAEVTKSLSLDGMMTSKVGCLLDSQICEKMEDQCAVRLPVLDQCLPSLATIENGDFDCEAVLCNCERSDKGLMNYEGKAMELPMSDMCTEYAESNFQDSLIPERYALLQKKCGAKFLYETDEPTLTPTISPAPSISPTTDSENIVALIERQQTDASPINSVVSGLLLALAITGVASIFLLFVLALWRKRFRSAGRKIQTVEEMKAEAQEKIRKLEAEVRRMEEQQGQGIPSDIEDP